jgi:hypothetical protein
VFVAEGVSFPGYIEDIVKQSFAGYANVLEVGEVKLFDMGGEFFQIDENNYFSLFQQGFSAPGRPVLNLFAVGAIAGAFEGAAGFSPGAPGLPLYAESFQNGVVWQVFENEDIDKMILRHETGHFSGLQHTTEFGGQLGDTLEDTPFCPDIDSVLDQCPDYGHIMFPTGGAALLFSDTQRRVIVGSSLYRGRVEEGGGLPGPLGAPSPAPIQPRVGGAKASLRGVLPAASPVSWSTGLPPALAHVLAGVGCGVDMLARRPSDLWFDLGLGSLDERALVAAALAPDAPTHVRRRLLLAVGVLARSRGALASEAARALLEPLALDPLLPVQARVGALEGLRAAGGASLAAQASLEVDSLPAIRAASRVARPRLSSEP